MGHESQVEGHGCGGNLAIGQANAESIGLHGGSQDSGPLGGLGVKGENADTAQKCLHRSGEPRRLPTSSSVAQFHHRDGADGHLGWLGPLQLLHHGIHAAQVVTDATGIQEVSHANGSLAVSFLPGRSMGSSQAPALARKAADQVLTTGSMTMHLPSQRSRTRVPRGRRQSPTKRTARLLPTLKTTVSPFMQPRISVVNIRSSSNVASGVLPPSRPAHVDEASLFQGTEWGKLSRNDLVGSVVLARSACANPSSFARYGPRAGPRLAHSSACASICFAITSLPTESSQLRQKRGPMTGASR